MWNKEVEFRRLVALRKAMFESMKGDPSLTQSISLTLSVHVGRFNSRTTGDLDNFVTGICDGLQAADRRAMTDRWCEPECESVHPRNVFAIADDAEVMSIIAKKVAADESPWYSIELHGE